jgi:hypothetical protein
MSQANCRTGHYCNEQVGLKYRQQHQSNQHQLNAQEGDPFGNIHDL